MTRGKEYCGNKATRKNARCDRQRSPTSPRGDNFVDVGHLYRPFFKKRGGGKGDWGCPGDEMVEAPVDPRDPIFDSDWSEAEFEAALFKHMSSPDDVQSPISEEDFVFVYEHECPKVDCDLDTSRLATQADGVHESPKGSWLHTFFEPSPLKLPHNAMWPLVPVEEEAESATFFYD